MTALNLKDLVGLTLSKHWTIVSMKDRGEGATGSMHSYGFVAQHSSGRLGFVKILNPALNCEIEEIEAQLRDLEIRIARFRYERDLLKTCVTRNIKKVVRLIEDGVLEVEGQTQPLPFVSRRIHIISAIPKARVVRLVCEQIKLLQPKESHIETLPSSYR